jgi:twinkle protein
VVSVPDGAKISSAERNKPWLDRLEAFQEIVICMDADKPGREGAESLAALMGEDRCRVVEYPPLKGAKDATDYWREGQLDALVKAIAEARGKPHPLVVGIGSPDIAESIRKQHEDPDPHGIPTGWKSVDELLGGMRPAELTILTAHTGCGKSAWVVNLLTQLAQGGTPVIGASFELSTEDYVWRFLQKLTGKFPWGRPDSLAAPLTPTERDQALDTLGTLPIWIVRHFGIMGVEQFCEAIRYAARRLGVRVAVLDHIHFMLVGSGDDERHVLSDAMYQLKSLARELGISIVVVAHPSRAARGKVSPDLSDLHGSASLEQIADNVVTLARVPEGETPSQGRAIFAVKKLRAGRSGRLGQCDLIFRRAGESFEDIENEGGWDDQAERGNFAEGF